MSVPSLLATLEEDALKGLFRQVYGRHSIRAQCQPMLVRYFAGRGETLGVLPLTPDASDLDAWTMEWTTYAKGAGLADEADQLRLINWLKAKIARPDAHSGFSSSVKLVTSTLLEDGVTLTAAQQAKLDKRLLDGEKGDEESQCVCADTCIILHLGRAATTEEREEWSLQFEAMGGKGGGVVEIERFTSYIKLHDKTGAEVITLSRALKSELNYSRWLSATIRKLQAARLPLAALRLSKVDSVIAWQTKRVWARRAEFLYEYFFEEYKGLGLPTDKPLASSLSAVLNHTMPEEATLGQVTKGSTLGSVVEPRDSASNVGSGTSTDSAMSSALTVLMSRLDSIEKRIEDKAAGGGGGGTSTLSRCPHCKRRDCPVLSGDLKNACHEFYRGAKLVNKEKSDKEKEEGKE